MTRLPSCSTRCGDLLPSVCYTGYMSTEAFPASPSQEPLGSVKIRGGRLRIETTHLGVHDDPSPGHILSEAQALEKQPQETACWNGRCGEALDWPGRAQCSTTISAQQAAGKTDQHWAFLVHEALSKLKNSLSLLPVSKVWKQKVPGGHPRPQMPGSKQGDSTW